MFLTENIATQPGTIALVPQVVDVVKVPVIAGTAYLFTSESLITSLHREALKEARDDQTALTNVFSGRPARGLLNRVMREVGPMSTEAPAFPKAGRALAPLKAKSEAQGSSDFSSLWSGQAAGLVRETNSIELTQRLAADAREVLSKGAGLFLRERNGRDL
jgi:nitronate monooxygenase